VTVTGSVSDDGANVPYRSIIVNGKSDSSTRWDIHTLRLSAHIPALFCRNEPKKTMVVGLGTGVTAGELSLHQGVEKIEVAEISPTVIEALPYFGDYTYEIHRNPKLKIHLGDAFRIIGRSTEKWDVIVSEPSNPWVTGVDLLFTDRFYEQVQPHLSEGGVFLQWVQIYNTAPEVLGMVMRTISSKFRFVRVFAANTGDLLLLASQHDLTAEDIERAEHRWRGNPALQASLADIGIASLDNLLLREIWSPEYIRGNFGHHEIQSMDRPRLHYLAGKHLFLGSHLRLDALLSAKTAAYWPSYALAKRYADWPGRCFDEEFLTEIVSGLNHVVFIQKMHSIAEAVALKAMSIPDCSGGLTFSGTTNDATRALLRIIAEPGAGEEEWEMAGLGEDSAQDRVAALIGVVQRNRNWIVPYPLHGLRVLLDEGFKESATPEEKNWFLLQQAQLRIMDGASAREIETLLASALRDAEGKVMIPATVQNLLAEVSGFCQLR
jgi:spermidine synthase